jgi:biofilm PGA synthesis lipoprotein PgaB
MRASGLIWLALFGCTAPCALAADPAPRGVPKGAPDVQTPATIVPAAEVSGAFTVLSYHEVRREVRDFADPFAVDSSALVAQFSWLRENGFVPVSLNAIVTARNGGKALPPKAVLLSFDDAYLSFYTNVYPLLREFDFPAVLGVVGRWIDHPRDGSVQYGEKGSFTNARFPSWGQLREMADSGLVEIASHTYDLHHGILANPQGNLQPAATARLYDAATRRYENDAAWRQRVRADLARNSVVIERETGRRPRAVVWPYGAYNDELVKMAGELGMPVALTLDDGSNTRDVPLTAMRRVLLEHNPSLTDFTTEQRGPLFAEPVRVVQVDLDDVYDPDPLQQERNLSMLLDRVEVLRPTHVFLHALSDETGAGATRPAAYFPNRHLLVRADLFNRVSWQLTSRDDVKLYAVMPVTGYGLTKEAVADLYEDLARHANFDGLVFDEGMLAQSQPDAAALSRDPALVARLAARVRAFRAPLKTVGATRRPRDVGAYATQFDYVALSDVDAVSTANPLLRRKLVVMLDNDAGLAAQMRALQLGGILNFGYVRDDFAHDRPALTEIAPAMSLRVYPQVRKGVSP